MIQFVNVSHTYNNRLAVLSDVSFAIQKGEFVFLTGDSSSGKSTLLKHIYMDEFPTSGTVRVGAYNSRDIKKHNIPLLRRTLGIVFQDFRLLTDRTVFENIAFAMRVTGKAEHEVKHKVLEVLALTGLSPKASCLPQQLSSGEQQRVCIARALVNNPDIILADEPTGNLDDMVSKEIVALFQTINNMGTTIVMASHDNALLQAFPHRTIELTHGRISNDTVQPERTSA